MKKQQTTSQELTEFLLKELPIYDRSILVELVPKWEMNLVFYRPGIRQFWSPYDTDVLRWPTFNEDTLCL